MSLVHHRGPLVAAASALVIPAATLALHQPLGGATISPPARSTGDLLVAAAMSSSSPTWPAITGWTKRADDADTESGQTGALYSRVATGDASDDLVTPSISGTKVIAIAALHILGSTAVTWHATGKALRATTSSFNLIVPSVTAPEAGLDLLFIAGEAAEDLGATPPAGFTTLIQADANVGGGFDWLHGAVMSRSVAAGSTGAATVPMTRAGVDSSNIYVYGGRAVVT